MQTIGGGLPNCSSFQLRNSWLNSQLEASKKGYVNARAHLAGILDLAHDAHALYMTLDDSLRRICNQAFFEKIWISDTDTITADPNQGFQIVLHKGIQQAALRANRPDDAYDLATFEDEVAGLNITGWVNPAGLDRPDRCVPHYVRQHRGPSWT
ncbi:MAG: hypothetical protein LBU38_02945 [Propionibacteriaceae bacterium]|nr:hypothetical protein [Propionibacteriaceae bacterium]